MARAATVGNDGDDCDDSDNDGGGGSNGDAKRRQTQQSNIKPTSTVRTVVWVQASQTQLLSGKTEGMVDGWCWGWEVVLRITGVQKTKKEMAKILPVDRADT
jgi:hypothetical protein